jgi:hypothetical protein
VDKNHIGPVHLRNLGRVVAQAWADPTFKQRLKADPTTVLAENGIQILAGVDIEVVENTPTKTYLTIPTPKVPIGASNEEIELVAKKWEMASGSSSCFTCSPCVDGGPEPVLSDGEITRI